MATKSVTAEARLRTKSQLTLPEPIVVAAGVEPGDRFVVEVAPDEPDTIRLHRVRASYAGAFGDLFDDPAVHLADERATWERDAGG